MKNKFVKFILSTLLCVSVAATPVLFGACSDKKPDEDKKPPVVQTKSFSVYFDRNCDDESIIDPDPQKVEEGKTAVEPAAPARRGYELEGWYLDAECTQKYDFSSAVTAEITLYANWVEAVASYTITFDLKGGTGETPSVTVKEGSKVEAPADPAKSGCVFGGWYLDEAYNMAYNFDNAVKGSFTLYAKWLNVYEVTFNLNYEGSTPVKKTVTEGEALPTVEVSRDDFNFAGWFTDADCTTAFGGTAVTANITLYAKWVSTAAETFTYTFNYNYEGAPAAAEITVVDGALVTAPDLKDVTPAGKAFDGWYSDAECTQPFDILSPATASQTLYAKWVGIVTVTYNYNYEGAPEGNDVTLKSGETVVRPADPVRVGYTFAGWSTAANAEPNFTFGSAVTSSVTLFAQWSKQYVFEAEDLDFSDIRGWGFSGNAVGTDAINEDKNGDAFASNGFYAWCLNATDLTLDFMFTSDRAAEGVDFTMRLSAEIKDITIVSSGNPDRDGVFRVNVNGTDLDYGEIEFLGVPAQSTGDILPFEDYTFKINIKEGENHIKLIVANSVGQGGTMQATAPMVDCIKLRTSAVLEFTPVKGNY